MEEFLSFELISIGEWTMQLRMLIGFLFFLLAHTALLLFLLKKWNDWFDKSGILEWSRKQNLRKNFLLIWHLVLAWGIMAILGLNPVLYQSDEMSLYVSTLLMAGIFLIIASLLDKVLNKILYDRHQRLQNQEGSKRLPTGLKHQPESSRRTLLNVVIVAVLLTLIRGFGIDFVMFEIPTGPASPNLTFRLTHIFLILLTFFSAKLLSWVLTQFILVGYYRSKDLNPGLQYAINQILSYFIYVIAIFMVIDILGIQFTLLLGGLAALLVGIGLGLQQTFNDLVSGIILLFERSIEVGDVIEFEGTVGAVQRIGVRTSHIETRDHIIIIVPNSKLITDRVINWSHFDDKARFRIPVGVAYGSDTRLVEKVLLEVARENEMVLDVPSPTVQFRDFGNSSLNFLLFFWSREYINIERIKSELRFEIDLKFRENGITIPFPQRDLWLKNPEELKKPE